MITMNDLTKRILNTLVQCDFMNTIYLRKMTIEDIIRVFSSKSEYDQAVSNLEKNDGDFRVTFDTNITTRRGDVRLDIGIDK